MDLGEVQCPGKRAPKAKDAFTFLEKVLEESSPDTDRKGLFRIFFAACGAFREEIARHYFDEMIRRIQRRNLREPKLNGIELGTLRYLYVEQILESVGYSWELRELAHALADAGIVYHFECITRGYKEDVRILVTKASPKEHSSFWRWREAPTQDG
jgi:hypothetical protein